MIKNALISFYYRRKFDANRMITLHKIKIIAIVNEEIIN